VKEGEWGGRGANYARMRKKGKKKVALEIEGKDVAFWRRKARKRRVKWKIVRGRISGGFLSGRGWDDPFAHQSRGKPNVQSF